MEQDLTLDVIKQAENAGFTHAILLYSERPYSRGKKFVECPVCKETAKTSNASPIPLIFLTETADKEKRIDRMDYATPQRSGFAMAPLFSLTHPGCRCWLKLVSSYDNYSKASMIISYDGSTIGEVTPLEGEAADDFLDANDISWEEYERTMDEIGAAAEESESSQEDDLANIIAIALDNKNITKEEIEHVKNIADRVGTDKALNMYKEFEAKVSKPPEAKPKEFDLKKELKEKSPEMAEKHEDVKETIQKGLDRKLRPITDESRGAILKSIDDKKVEKNIKWKNELESESKRLKDLKRRKDLSDAEIKIVMKLQRHILDLKNKINVRK